MSTFSRGNTDTSHCGAHEICIMNANFLETA